ncbi:MAG: hypothetical protein ACQEXJ_10175 [Myxococcota bacterium]
MKFRIHPGAAIAAFFGILMAFNVAFYVIAFNNPPELLPEAERSGAPAEPTPTATTAPPPTPDPAPDGEAR